MSRTAGKKVIYEPSSQTAEGLVLPEEMLKVGDLYTVIDWCYKLEQTAEAHRYVDAGQKKGNVVITVVQDSED